MELTINQHSVYAYTANHTLQADQASIIFVHGAGMDHSAWILQSRYFAYHQYNSLAIDLPGHGRSQGAPLASIVEQADWLAELIALNTKTAILVGHSMGSLAVLECAARHADKVRGLVLMGTAVPMPVGKALLDAAQANEQAAIDMIVHWAHRPQAHLGGNQTPGLWLTGVAQRLLERAKPNVLYTDLKACNDYQGLKSVSKVVCPTLFVLGEQDKMTPPKAAQQAIAHIRQAHVTTLSNSGHMMMTEQPDKVLNALIHLMQIDNLNSE